MESMNFISEKAFTEGRKKEVPEECWALNHLITLMLLGEPDQL